MPKNNKKTAANMKEPVLSFKLSRLTEILFRENSVIANEDVPILLKVLLEDRGFPVPRTIELQILASAVERGDAEAVCEACGDPVLYEHNDWVHETAKRRDHAVEPKKAS